MTHRLLGCILGLALVTLLAGDALADRRHWDRHGPPPHARWGHGPAGFDRWGPDPWHRGHWHRGYHGGRGGWWWIVGPRWYYYAAPVYPYPPPVVIVPAAPPPPPQVIVAPRPEPYCREYQAEAVIDGAVERYYGTACRQPDGSWRIVN